MPIISTLIPIVFFIAVITLLIFLARNSAKIKGKVGEIKTSLRLNHLTNNEYKVLNNIILKTKNNRTVQIDHIIVSVYGIFVIETKNYKGWIFGNENAENWMQIIYNEKHPFRNPVKQNWSHIYVLKELLSDFPNMRYIPIVVFSGSGVLKEISSSVYVIYDLQLLKVIKRESNEKILTQDEVQKITGIIKRNNIQDKETEKKHIENIHETVIEKQLKKENLICPKCENELILREGKYGKFYGCSNYPYCRFTMKY